MLLSFYAIQDVHAAEEGNSSQFELIYEDIFFNLDVQSSNKNIALFDSVSFSKNDTEWYFPDGDTFEFIPINRERKIIPKQPTDNIFLSHQIISYYGYPNIPVMGELGKYSPEIGAKKIKELALQHKKYSEPRDVKAALHLIVDVAQGNPTPDGDYIYRLDEIVIAEYVEAARLSNILLFLDLQIGWGNLENSIQTLEKYLKEPFVHLALDPEFAAKDHDKIPGDSIGYLNAIDINSVQMYLQDIVREYTIPSKILVIHQFRESMILETSNLVDVEEVLLTIDMDGFGTPQQKIHGYEKYALAEYAEYAALKLFYEWDTPVLTTEAIAQLESQPNYLIYQ